MYDLLLLLLLLLWLHQLQLLLLMLLLLLLLLVVLQDQLVLLFEQLLLREKFCAERLLERWPQWRLSQWHLSYRSSLK